MLVVVATIRARKGMENQVMAELMKLPEPTRVEDGCFHYDMHQSQSDPCQFVFLESWRDKAALEVHLNTPHLQAWRAFEHMSGALAEPVKIELFDRINC